jgi:hypothetical protein
MNVIPDATDDDGFKALVVGDPCHVGPEVRLEIVLDAGPAFFCAEDHVDTVAGIRV